MGVFTWTDASVSGPKKNAYGEYRKRDKIDYGGYARIVCPDNSVIEESCYGGYGMFGGRDAYDLVADWNREAVKDMLEASDANDLLDFLGCRKIAELFAEGRSDDEITEAVRLIAE